MLNQQIKYTSEEITIHVNPLFRFNRLRFWRAVCYKKTILPKCQNIICRLFQFFTIPWHYQVILVMYFSTSHICFLLVRPSVKFIHFDFDKIQYCIFAIFYLHCIWTIFPIYTKTFRIFKRYSFTRNKAIEINWKHAQIYNFTFCL